MGPALIFDKSFLESLNPDEAMWLDNFFLCNITPLFFIETLADLEKDVRKGRTPESIVGSLAYRTPDQHSQPNIYHRHLLEGELLAKGTVDMKYGRPHIGGGRTVTLGGQTGVFFQASPEVQALQRWRDFKFLELERLQAKAWREGLSGVDLDGHYKYFQTFFPLGKPKTLDDVKRFTDFYVSNPDQERLLIFGLTLMGVLPDAQEEVIKRWKLANRPPLKEFAPYFMHIFAVDLFFYLAIAADLIGRGRPSHKIDLAYLYYLPFCKIFTSNDKLHEAIAPYFLRSNQSFVSGKDLKADLAQLDAHFSALPEEIKERGVMSFAHYPPHDESFLVTRLWDKHMSKKWRDRTMPIPNPTSPVGKELMDRIRQLEREGKPVTNDQLGHSDESDQLIIKRNVRVYMGKWKRFPPEVVNRQKNVEGEGDWEDTPTA